MGHKYPRADRVTTVKLHGWLCNKISGFMPGEIPCGMKASRLSQQIVAATNKEIAMQYSTGY